MAKQKKFNMDPFSGNNLELDLPDIDFGDPLKGIKDNRKPIAKFASGAVKGAKDVVVTSSFLKNVIKRTLPDGFGEAIDFSDNIASAGKNLYNETAAIAKPLNDDLKRAMRKVLPTVEDKIPKSISDVLKNYARADNPLSFKSDTDYRGSEIERILASTFESNVKMNRHNRAEDDAREALRVALESKRHKDTNMIMDQIRIATIQNTEFHTKVSAAYMRKSLEIQLRHYYASVDILEETKRSNFNTNQQLAGILKNTSLPEFVKVTNADQAKKFLGNKFSEVISQNFFGQRSQFVNNLTNVITKNLLSKVKAAAGGASTIFGEAGNASSMASNMGEYGMDPTEEAGRVFGNVAGGAAGDALLSKNSFLGRHLTRARSFVSRNKAISKAGNNASFWVNNAPQMLERFSRSRTNQAGFGANGLDFIKDLVRGVGTVDNTVAFDKRGTLNDPVVFNRRTAKSINEIIPGLLSRIHQELVITRTGNTKAPRLTYDYDRNRFDTERNTNLSNLGRLFDPVSKGNLSRQVEAVMKQLDPTGNKLTPEQRQLLGRQLMRGNVEGTIGDKKSMTNYNFYKGDAAKHAGTYVNLFNDYFDQPDPTNSRKTSFNSSYRNLGATINDSRERIQAMINDGQSQLLEELGILKTGRIQMSQVYEYFGDKPFDEAALSKIAAEQGIDTKARGGRTRSRADRNFTANRTYNRTTNNYTQAMREAGGGNNDAIIEAIREANNRDVLEATRDAIMRIEDRLASGTYMSGGMSGPAGAPIDKAAAQAATKTPWWKMPLWKAPGAAAAGVGRGAATAFNAYRSASARMGAGVNRAISALTGGAGWAAKKLWESGAIGAAGRGAGWLVKNGVQAGFSGIANANRTMNTIRNGVFSTVPKVLSGAGAAASGIVDVFRVAKDIYTNRVGMSRPTLYADAFNSGEYRSAKTNKVLKRGADIDGPVLDKNDNVVLTEDDIKAGLLDSNGKKMHFGAAFAMHKAGELAGKGALGIFRGIATADNVLNSGVNFVKGILGRIIGPQGIVLFGGKTMVTRLTEIRDILDARLPGKKVFGDTDGDGIRDNSVEDLNRKDKAKASDKEAQEEKRANLGFGKTGALGALTSVLGGLFKKKPAGKDEGTEENGTSSAAGAAGGAAAAGAGGWALSKLKGLGKGLWGAGKGIGKGFLGKGLLGKVLAPLAIYEGGKSAYDLATGKSESKLTDGATAAFGAWSLASLVGGGSALAGLGTIGSGIASGVAGLAGLISLPVVAIGAAAAGLGYGAYKLIQFMTKKSLTLLSKVRVAQYGIMPDDKDHASTLFGLEDKLQKYITFKGDTPKIDLPKDVKAKDLMEPFGIDSKDDTQASAWIQWFMNRFKPVFFAHLSALHAINPKLDLGDIEQLDVDQKKKYLSEASFPDGPYNVKISPFKDLKELPVGRDGVADIVAATQAKLDKMPATGKVDAGAVAEAAGLGAGSIGAGDDQKKADLEKAKTGTTASGAGAGAASAAGMGAGVGIANPVAELNNPTSSGVADYSAKASVDVGNYAGASQGRVDALTAIRYKTYGLTEMDVTKTRALDSLEIYLGPQLKYDNNGKATWDGKLDDVLKYAGAAFGVSPDTPGGYNWLTWFRLRFLPTFLNWASISNKKTSRKNPIEANTMLREQDKLDVAMAVITTKTNYGGADTSVWMIPTSPWAGYKLNESVKSTDDNVQGLREVAKKLVTPEEAQSSSGLKKDAADKAADSKAMNEAGTKNKGIWAKLFGGDDDGKDGAKGGSSGGIWGSVKDAIGGVFGGKTAADVRGGRGGGDASVGGGSEIQHPGQGTGGDVNALPKPTGNKSYAAVKELIETASKMAGVDPKLMSTMAAIESGFNWQVKAPTSSASGLYQFIDSTWKNMIQKYGPKYGIAPGTSQLDPRANALMGAEYIKENIAALKGVVDRPLTDTDLYLAHFMGAGGARQFLKADPKAIAANVFPQAARANSNIFYQDNQPLTIGQVYQKLNGLVKGKGKSFGLGTSNDGSEAMTNNSASSGTTATGASASGTTATPSAPASQSPDMSPDGSGRNTAPKTQTPTPDSAAQVMGSGFAVDSPSAQSARANLRRDTTDPALTASGSAEAVKQLVEIGLSQLEQQKMMVKILSGLGGLGNLSDSSSNGAVDSARQGRAAANGPGQYAPTPPISLAKTR